MKENFDSAMRMVLNVEGGILDDADDAKRAGGITNLGITQNIWDKAVAQGLVPNIPLKEAQPEHALLIYRAWYWDAVRADDLPGPIDALATDFAVNCGVYHASIRLQRAVNRCGYSLVEDGRIGPKTLATVRQIHDERGKALAAVYLLERVDRYSDLLNGDPQGDPDYKWIHGWLERVERLRRYAGV